ncbi:MAG: hypothetical protein ICV78_27070, partial [Tolypothrix sp. Co-bin9]|nr:hypothetical protein [Tolypothrix sp. Co-bin9]
MNNQYSSPHDDLFYEALINTYVNDPRFVQRSWLEKKIETELADPNCRFLLLTAEPGAGKTAFAAWLARQHQKPKWYRYFIRRDSQTPLSSGDANSFLFTLGHQLATQRPQIFRPKNLEVVVNQRVGVIRNHSTVIGIKIEDLKISPFYKTALKVDQEVGLIDASELEGLSVKRMVGEPRFLELGNLQYLA